MRDSRADMEASASKRKGIPGVRYSQGKSGKDDVCEIPAPITPNPGILLQTLVFYSKPWYFTPNPGTLIHILVFYSKPWHFTPNPGILLQTLVL